MNNEVETQSIANSESNSDVMNENDSIDELLDIEYENDDVCPADPDNSEWRIPQDPPADVFMAEFRKSSEEPAKITEDDDTVLRVEYKSIRGNLPPQMYNLMTWLDNSDSYPLSVVPTCDDITLATMDAFCEAFKKIDPSHLDNIEIEGRLGLLVNNNLRIFPPCASESILFNDSNSKSFLYRKFSSEVFPKDFETIIHYLRHQKINKVRHVGERTIADDIFKGYRVRKYEKLTKEGKVVVKEVTKKHALMTLDIVNPRYKYDYRIQVNVEEPLMNVLEDDLRGMQRTTKRQSFQHGNIGYDMSEIDQTNLLPQGNIYRSLVSAEIEALNPKDTFYKHFKAKEAGQPSRMLELTRGFVGHLRELSQLFPNEHYVAASLGTLK
eukprot:NODE_141_length_17903_cov_0.288643.p4 type:complete len:382 gc:universal NODE_141_length_17903_cov_0.288643:13998-12853(-)